MMLRFAQLFTTCASSLILFGEFAAYNDYILVIPSYAYVFVLVYVVAITFNGLFSLRIGDYYALTPHESNSASLL